MANLGTLVAKLELDGAVPPQRIDADELAAQTARTLGAQNAGFVDVRDGAALQRELERMDYQISANRADAGDAEREVVSTTGRLAQLTKVRKQIDEVRDNREKQSRLDRVDKEIEDVKFVLAQQKQKLDVSTRIAENREKVRKEFLESRPFDGAMTTKEVIEEQRKLENLDRVIEQTV